MVWIVGFLTLKEIIMRKIRYSEYVKKTRSNVNTKGGYQSPTYMELEDKGEAVFHQWGSDYEEFDTGAGNYSTAIIELPDGEVKNIPADHIKFIDQSLPD